MNPATNALGERSRSVPSARGAANGRNIGRLLFRSLYRLNVVGAGNVPHRGRLIVAANHIGFLDGPLLFSASPRPLHLVAKSELFDPPFDKVLSGVGQIPLDYESPDRAAVQDALGVLEDGRALGIFPEAHRGRGDFARIRHGIAYLHSRTNAPIVPAAIFGTRLTGMTKNQLPKARSELTVVFGEPFRVAALGDIDSRATLAAMGESIRQHLADHLVVSRDRYGLSLPQDAPSDQTLGTNNG